jgi:hypothetical protein
VQLLELLAVMGNAEYLYRFSKGSSCISYDVALSILKRMHTHTDNNSNTSNMMTARRYPSKGTPRAFAHESASSWLTRQTPIRLLRSSYDLVHGGFRSSITLWTRVVVRRNGCMLWHLPRPGFR